MRKTVQVLLCMVWLMLCAALPAFWAEAHPMSRQKLQWLSAQNPAIQGAAIIHIAVR